ncbi:hypothetical protein [Roseivirga sp. E12]|uniref:hypothetical protein n=1 Tax=Roseivirga sp. E12 TaxID=2819237 RepID=UPI001ABD02B9|nr:hypothetical protein [Roseivirga sp. E12]MBO3698733.1 hypothetical protein [Roseivirga sp. E12]
MSVTRLFFSLLISSTLVSAVCAQEESQNQKAESHILKVMSEYKNPWAYYPLRRDIFLPSEEEVMKTELKNSYPDNSFVVGPFIFMKPGAEVDREPFVDASGRPMFQNFFRAKKPASLSSSSSFFLSKQKRLLSAHPTLGKFLLYNEGFLKLK